MKITIKPKKFPLLAFAAGFLPVIVIWLFVAIVQNANLLTIFGILLFGLFLILAVIWVAFRANRLELDGKEIRVTKFLSPTVTIPLSDIKSISLYKRSSYTILSAKYIKNGRLKIAALGSNVIYDNHDLIDVAQNIRHLNPSIAQ